MISDRTPNLIFAGEFDEREKLECRDRGYRSHVWVELANDERYPVVFYDPVRLSQDVQAESEAGHPYVAEPGLIVVPEVTRENMEDAVCNLLEEGYFESLRPVSQDAETIVTS